ncbi:hypothetical protein [Streptobacillus moniliformis]|nr:hypothetical protein [Streptobacillus moniliformis]
MKEDVLKINVTKINNEYSAIEIIEQNTEILKRADGLNIRKVR